MSNGSWMRALWIAGAVGCGDTGGFPDAMAPEGLPPGGTFSLAWNLVNLEGGRVTCDQVGGVTMTTLLRNRGVQGGSTEVFSCETGYGETPAIAPGIYDIRFELNGATGLIATAPEQLGVVVESGKNTMIDNAVFRIDPVGGLELTFDALATGGNCAAVTSNGAGITGMTIALEHAAGGACEPATLMIGSTPYMVDCMTPVEVGCIEATTKVTAMGVPSDAYQIHVRGKQGALTCYANDDAIRVPPNGMTFTRTLNLAPTGAAGCQ